MKRYPMRGHTPRGRLRQEIDEIAVSCMPSQNHEIPTDFPPPRGRNVPAPTHSASDYRLTTVKALASICRHLYRWSNGTHLLPRRMLPSMDVRGISVPNEPATSVANLWMQGVAQARSQSSETKNQQPASIPAAVAVCTAPVPPRASPSRLLRTISNKRPGKRFRISHPKVKSKHAAEKASSLFT